MFQRAGTIVPQQDPSNIVVMSDIRNVPVDLSISLKEGKAHGYLYLEDGSDSNFKTEIHEIWAENDVISFKQQDSYSQNAEANDTVIGLITLTFVDRPINQACALYKDMVTVQTLYAIGYNDTRKQVSIQARDDNNPTNPFTPLKINEIAYIYYGYSE